MSTREQRAARMAFKHMMLIGLTGTEEHRCVECSKLGPEVFVDENRFDDSAALRLMHLACAREYYPKDCLDAAIGELMAKKLGA